MRSSLAVVFCLCIMMIPPSVMAAEGRAEPNCSEVNASSFSSATAIEAGQCIKVNLGVLIPGDVFDISIIIIDDSMDVLVFDQNTILPYDLGQSYRSSFEQVPSTESAFGELKFHWKVPASINYKTWFIVFDNTAHSGDQGLGDQGGSQSRASLSVTPITQSYWTPFHDLIEIDSGASQTLLSGEDLRLDSGTTIVVTAWSLEGQGDVYLQTRTMNNLYLSEGVGSLFITGASLQSIDDSGSFSWIVPNELDGEELIVIADNTDTPVGGGDGSESVRMTVRVELAPQLNPVISDNGNASTVLSSPITLDAYSTPNRLNQIASAAWDFDSSIDQDNDGDASNDVDGTGWETEAVWTTPGDRTVTLTVTSPTGDTASSTSIISVNDVVTPVARIAGDGQPINGGWKIATNQNLTLDCGSSSDDYNVEFCSWTLDGTPYQNPSQSLTFSWQDIGVHSVTLTVADAAGNSDTVLTTIRVTDTSLPVLEQSSLNVLPSSGIVNEDIRCSAQATDSYDAEAVLRYHWDLNPDVDSDGNGNARDDADSFGSTADIRFDSAGRYDVVLTVFDQSNNSDSHAFSMSIDAAPSEQGIVGILAMVLFLSALTFGVALIGHRRWQRGIATELLVGRGLSQTEAKAQLSAVAGSRKLPLFAQATVLAGLDAAEVKPASVVDEEKKAAEMAAIYGTSQDDTTLAQQSFAPPQSIRQTMSEGSQAAAADALALFNDVTPASVAQPAPQLAERGSNNLMNELESSPTVQTVVQSGGVTLPEGVLNPEPSALSEPETTTQPIDEPLQITCKECSTVFAIRMPPGTKEVVVACPSCSSDTKVTV